MVEPLYPIDANLDLLHGIDFKKGCFVGQETTSRMKRRGQIKSRIAPIAYDGQQIAPGAEVLAQELGLNARYRVSVQAWPMLIAVVSSWPFRPSSEEIMPVSSPQM